jgi:hypothetical protein
MEEIGVKIRIGIIGAGLQGVTHAAYLLDRFGGRVELFVIDPSDLMGNWETTAAYMGMSQLRSGWGHPIFGDERSFRDFARSLPNGKRLEKADRPLLVVFNTYCHQTVRDFSIQGSHVPARVTGLRRESRGAGFVLTLDGEFGGPQELAVDKVICCTGLGRPFIPDFDGVRMHGIYHSAGVDVDSRSWEDVGVLIIGGGLTAGKLSLSLVGRGAHVTVAVQDRLLFQEFDFPPGWFGDNLYQEFRASNDRTRVATIRGAGIRGSVTEPVFHEMREAVGRDVLKVRENTRVTRFAQDPNTGRIRSWNRDRIVGEYDLVVLATGYRASIHDLGFLKGVIGDIQVEGCLPLFQGPGDDLQLFEGVYASGAIAQYGIGAAAANIMGGRLAAEIITNSIADSLR